MPNIEAGQNINSHVRELNHKDLRRLSSNSIFKSVCPACRDGVLAVRRNPKTLQLEEYDNCFLCGQRVKYLDIQKLREIDPFN